MIWVCLSLTNVFFGGMFVCNAKTNIIFVFYLCWCQAHFARLIDDSTKFFIQRFGTPRETKIKMLAIAIEWTGPISEFELTSFGKRQVRDALRSILHIRRRP